MFTCGERDLSDSRANVKNFLQLFSTIFIFLAISRDSERIFSFHARRKIGILDAQSNRFVMIGNQSINQCQR